MKQQLFTTDDAVSTACAVNTKHRGRLLAMAAGILSVLILLVTAMQFVISAGADRYSEYSNSCRKYMMAFMKNDSTYSQLVNATRLPYRNYVESLQRDQGFLNSLTAWKAANLDLSGGVSEITQSAEYKYYLGILMDLMTDTVNETNLLDAADAYMDALHISLAKQSVNTLKKYNELSMKVDKEDSETLLNEIGMLEEASDVLDLIGDIGNVIEKANDFGDLIDKISQLCAIHDLTKGYSEVMRFMCDACDSDNIALKSALAYMRDVTSGALTEEMASAILTGQTVADDALKSVLGAVKKSVLSVMGYGGTVISFAQSLSKYVANQLFATDNIQSAFYKSRALYDIEDLLRLALKGTSSADRFFAAFSLYENVMYKGADYSVSYYKAVYEDSIFGKVFAWIQGNGDAASKFKSMMSDEKDRLKVSFDNLQRRAYNGYKGLAHTSEVGNLNVRQEYIIPDLSDLVENDAQLNKLSIETYGLPDEDYTLTEDMTLYANVYHSNGTIDLNGHSLTILGDLVLEGGGVKINGGRLNISGDYNAAIPVKNSNGTTGYTGGYLDMGNINDKVTVSGDFNSYYNYDGKTLDGYVWNDQLQLGTIEIKGNLNDYYNDGSSSSGLYSNGTKFIFSGAGKQTITATDGYIRFSDVDFVDTENRVLAVNCEIYVQLCSDTYITGDTAVRGKLNGYDLNVSGNLTVNSDLYIQSGCLDVKGNLNNYGQVNLDGGTLIIESDYNAYKSTANKDGTTTYSEGGYIDMNDNVDKVSVYGDFNSCRNYCGGDSLYVGTIEIKGDLNDYYCYGDGYNTGCGIYSYGTKFIFSGTGKQTITALDGLIYFEDVDFVNTQDREFVVNCEIYVKLCSDTYITGDAAVRGKLNGHLLNVSGNLTVNNSIDIAGGDIVVEGDLYNYGSISLSGGYLTVNGNYNAYKSTTNKDGTITYSNGGYLDMYNAVEKVTVNGDFNTCCDYSNHSHYLNKGTIVINGNLIDYYNDSSNYGLYSNGTKFIFSGAGKQTITATDGYIRFSDVDFVDTENRELVINCEISADLCSDTYITGDATVCGNLNGHLLNVSGNLTVNNSIDVAGGDIVVKGDLYNYGSISLNGGYLTLNGNYNAYKSTTNKDGTITYSEGGYLDTDSAVDKVIVSGDFNTCFNYYYSGTLCYGTIEIKGDLNDYFNNGSTNSDGVYSNGTKFIFNGTGTQIITALDGKLVLNTAEFVNKNVQIDCSTEIDVDVPVKVHDYSDEWTVDVEAACNDGSKSHHCTRCDAKTDITVIPATGKHSFGDWKITKAATCTAEGTQTRTCSVCKKVETQTIEALGHTEVTDKAVAATCTKTGLTEGIHCSVCDAVIKAQEVVPATGKHSFGNWKITKAATCTAEGTQTRTCSGCGKVETQTIAKTAHKYVNTVVKPTYTAKGYTLHKCSVCGTSYKDTYTAKLTLAKVTGVKLGGRAADALRVNWSKNASADGYIVEMYQGNKWVRVAKITSNVTTTYRASGLKASTVYKFRVRAYKMEGKTVAYGAYSIELAARTNPSVMTGVKLSGRAADALRINWSKNASADGYIVEMYQGNKWVRVAKITNSNTTTFRKAGLKASSVYKFRVRAYKMSGKTALYGNYSATVTARTNPSVVKGVKIAGKAKDALRVNWTKNSSAQGYIVEMYKGGKWVRVAKITNGNTTTFRKAGLAKNTAYKFRVCAYYMSGKTALYGNYGSVSGKTAAK